MNTSERRSPRVSVIVLNYNGAHHLPACLESLRAQDWANLEIIVADNASRDTSGAVAESFGVGFHRMSGNFGFSVTNNDAARVAAGDFLFFVNNDTRFDPTCVSRLMDVMLRDGAVFSADPKELDWEGRRIVHHALRFVRAWFFHKNFLPWIGLAGLDAPIEVPFGCGGAMLVRRRMFEEVGGFDETFLFDYEETDLSWRAWLRGWKTIYVPTAIVFHKVGGTFGELTREDRDRGVFRRRVSGQRNYLRFVLKTMPARIVGLVLFREMLRVVGHTAVGDRTVAAIRLQALLATLVALPAIVTARRKTLAQAVTSSAALIERFMVDGPGFAPAP